MQTQQDKETKKNKSSRLVKESGAYWRAITQHTPNHVMVLDHDGTILFINHTVPGLQVDKVIGTSVYSYLSEDAAQTARACYEHVFKTGIADHYEIRYTNSNGGHHIFENLVYPLLENDQVVAIINDARDISQIRDQQNKLEQKHTLLNTVVSQSPIIIWAVDAHGIFTLSEGRALKGTGTQTWSGCWPILV